MPCFSLHAAAKLVTPLRMPGRPLKRHLRNDDRCWRGMSAKTSPASCAATGSPGRSGVGGAGRAFLELVGAELAAFEHSHRDSGRAVPDKGGKGRNSCAGLSNLEAGADGRYRPRDLCATQRLTGRFDHEGQRERPDRAGRHHQIGRHEIVTRHADQPGAGDRRGAAEQRGRHIIGDIGDGEAGEAAARDSPET